VGVVLQPASDSSTVAHSTPRKRPVFVSFIIDLPSEKFVCLVLYAESSARSVR
jgi:hypothetical protein